MSDNTILGSAPSGAEPTPGESGRADSAGSESAAETDAVDAPGSAATAVHRSRLYALLALGFERPDNGSGTAVTDDAFADRLVESAESIDPDVAGVARSVVEHRPDSEALRSQWASLFGVEEGVTVSPYELTYLPGPLMTNIRRLADARGFYEAFDLSIAAGANDRGDHVCVLTEFVGQLCTREAYLRTEEDHEGVAVVVDAQRSFLEDHLGRWYWRFADEVSKHDDGGFYAALAECLAAFVEHEVERFDLDPDWVPDDPEVLEWNEDVFGDSGRGCGGCGADTDGVSLAEEGADAPTDESIGSIPTVGDMTSDPGPS